MVLNLSGIICHELAKTNELPEKYKDLACGPKVIGSCYDKNGNVIEDFLDIDHSKVCPSVYLTKEKLNLTTPFKWNFQVLNWYSNSWTSGSSWLICGRTFEYKNSKLIGSGGYDSGISCPYNSSYSFDMELSSNGSGYPSLNYICYKKGTDGIYSRGSYGMKSTFEHYNIKTFHLGFAACGSPNDSWVKAYKFKGTLHGSRLEVNGKLVFSRD